jgi:hypothetical protein
MTGRWTERSGANILGVVVIKSQVRRRSSVSGQAGKQARCAHWRRRRGGKARQIGTDVLQKMSRRWTRSAPPHSLNWAGVGDCASIPRRWLGGTETEPRTGTSSNIGTKRGAPCKPKLDRHPQQCKRQRRSHAAHSTRTSVAIPQTIGMQGMSLPANAVVVTCQ